MNDTQHTRLDILRSWCERELSTNILPWWETHARDLSSGGFFGAIDNEGNANPDIPRSVVMVSRFLWAHSAAARQLAKPDYLEFAHYAYKYLVSAFVDRVHGGVFWSVNRDGSPAVAKKQIYGEAFAIYGLSEYALALLATGDEGNRAAAMAAREEAISIFDLLEKRVRDRDYGAYGEAVDRDWTATKDLKLSGKDIDCDKSMNTNLHVMEAYSNLLRLETAFTGDILRVREALEALVEISAERILGADAHLDLYFDQQWQRLGGDIISYGHDIEASWLIFEAMELAVEAGGDHTLMDRYRDTVVAIARAALAEGFDPQTGGFDNEFHEGHRDTTRVWWCQAEAMVGFFNAWELSGDESFLEACFAIQSWVDRYQIDRRGGEWFASVTRDGKPILREAKGGNWKTAYHNGRACLELMRRIDLLHSRV